MSRTEIAIIDHLSSADAMDVRKLARLCRSDEPRENTGNGLIAVPTPLVSHYGDESGNLLDVSNHEHMVENLGEHVESWVSPNGLRQAWILIPAVDSVMREYVEMFTYVKEQYPVLDGEDWSSREYEATVKYFDEYWHLDWADSVSDPIQELYDNGHKDIADDILESAFRKGCERGYCDSFGMGAAEAEAVRKIAQWHNLRLWLIETSGGNQCSLF